MRRFELIEGTSSADPGDFAALYRRLLDLCAVGEVGATFGIGASDAELAALEAALGAPLRPEVRTVFAIANGVLRSPCRPRV
jgi:hypothetical protein